MTVVDEVKTPSSRCVAGRQRGWAFPRGPGNPARAQPVPVADRRPIDLRMTTNQATLYQLADFDSDIRFRASENFFLDFFRAQHLRDDDVSFRFVIPLTSVSVRRISAKIAIPR